MLNVKGFKFYVIALIFALCTLHYPKPSFAAKPRIWKTAPAKSASTSATRPAFSVKLRTDRKAVNIVFNYLNTASSTTYELTYISDGLDKGIFGSILPKEGSSATRSLLLGTCSKNVCTYHKNITDCKLKITCKLNSGKTLIKRYRIKV